MKKRVLATAVLALGAVAAQAATSFTNTAAGADLAVASNWDNGVPTSANVGTIGSGMVVDRTTDVDIIDQVITIANGGSLISDSATSFGDREFYGMGTVITVETGGTYMRTNGPARWTGGTLNVHGGTVGLAGLVPFDTGADPLVGGMTIDMTGGTLNMAKMPNFNDSETALPYTFSISGGTANLGGDSDTRLIDEENVFYNVSGGSLILNDHSFAAGGNDTNIVITVSNDGMLTTHNFDRNNNATALDDRYVNLLGEDGASWTWTGTNQAAFVTLWNAGTLKHDGANTGTFAENFTVSGDTLTVIPEPATLGLVMAFGGGILFIRRKLMM